MRISVRGLHEKNFKHVDHFEIGIDMPDGMDDEDIADRLKFAFVAGLKNLLGYVQCYGCGTWLHKDEAVPGRVIDRCFCSGCARRAENIQGD